MAQFDQLIMFYNQLLNMADEINGLIDKELFDDILQKMDTHEKLLIQIRLAKKCSKLTDAEQKEIDRLDAELKIKEKDNIEHLQKNMSDVKKELNRLNMQSRVKKAYGQEYNNIPEGHIIDVDDSYRPEKK